MVVTMDTDLDTSLGDQLVRTRIPKNAENICDNKSNVEWLLKQSLNVFKEAP